MKECYVCGKGNLIRKKIPYRLYGVMVGRFDGEQCTECGESFYSEKVFDEMTTKVKKLGLWGLETKTRLTKVGNSLDIRLNKRLVDFLGVDKGKEVTIIPENKQKITLSL
ncbi:YgiT-type zinc finger protein [Candidatus Woesearchaeota archaeon]|nr:YgiT-type zinc finger protein [Candidatus Woesearchaeota archaeon]